MAVEHKFGGRHTEIKLNVIQRYLEAYLHVMSGQNYRNIYVDAFAGTGSRTTTHNGFPLLGEESEGQTITPGSAQLVLQMDNKFDEYLFIDKKAKHVDALEKLCSRFPNKKTRCRQGDANELVQEFCRSTQWGRGGGYWGTRAVLFLDPYGMQVEWQTLKDIAATKAIDLWFLFPLSGLYRQAARNFDKIDEDKSKAIDRCLGTTDWRDALYEAATQSDFFADSERLERNAKIPAIEAYVKQRLQTEFTAWVSEPIPLRNTQGPQLFSLFFAMSNPSNPAKNIAQRIVRHLRKSIT
ncbi:three-Cys-motif partner protein TcmP [Thalassospira australica]|uniref:three-Cys-motif partner protein TcmP n=1 Tax=Thalassospira australica TaxID=1528106 RepID=UPI000519ED32|nr:three-Cys-motif partner protein TcmP [Thalassospira australica]